MLNAIILCVLFIFCACVGGIGRRLQGGLIDRIFFGKKNKWIKTETQLTRPADMTERVKAGSFGTTKARLVYAAMLIIAFLITIFTINSSLELTWKHILYLVLMFVGLWLSQTCGAFGSLTAGFVLNKNSYPETYTFKKKQALHDLLGLSCMGYIYCLVPMIVILNTVINTHTYLYLYSFILPFFWYGAYYFAWTHPIESDLFEIQLDDPLPTGELLSGAILGIMTYIAAISVLYAELPF